MANGTGRRRSRLGRFVRVIWLISLGVVALVIALTALWAVLPPVSTLMAARYVTLRPVQREYVPLERISPALVAAVVLSEDAAFCRHNGVDWKALGDVLEDAGDGGPSRGASTIAMQVAKNLFLWPSRSAVRKGLEIPLAMALDAVWPKRRMLEIYLNIAEWGPDGIFGAEAAARARFGKSARALNAHEAALLAKALPNPVLRNPARPSPGHARLARRLAARVGATGSLLDCLE